MDSNSVCSLYTLCTGTVQMNEVCSTLTDHVIYCGCSRCHLIPAWDLLSVCTHDDIMYDNLILFTDLQFVFATYCRLYCRDNLVEMYRVYD